MQARSWCGSLALLCCLATVVQAAPRVILVSIDGLRPELYRDPAAYGLKLPNLLALRDAGVSVDRLIPVFPSLTYPAHTSMVTGAEPAQHGVVSNFRTGLTWYRDATEIKVETLWDRARKAGMKTALIMWPMTYGAEADWLIPEDANKAGAALADSLPGASTPGLIDELEPACGRPQFPPESDPDGVEIVDRYSTCAAIHILTQHQPELMLLHLVNVDHIEHALGPHHAHALHALEVVDAHIGELRAALDNAGLAQDTVVVVVGDHGFVPVHTTINTSALLLDAGFATLEDESIRVDPDVVVATAGGAAAVYLRGASATTQVEQQLTQQLEQAVAAHFRGLLRVIPAAEVQRMGAFPGAALALAAEPGYLLLGAPRPDRTLPTGPYKGMHGYAPDVPEMATGFIAAGPQIRGDFRIPLMRQIDVGPTLARLMDLELPDAAGVPIIGLFDYSTRATAKDYGMGPQNGDAEH